MLERRQKASVDKRLLSGPGSLARALGIRTTMTGTSLTGSEIWIEDHGLAPETIQCGPRVGIDYAGADASLPYRFMTETVG